MHFSAVKYTAFILSWFQICKQKNSLPRDAYQASGRSLEDLLEELMAVHRAAVASFKFFEEEVFNRFGVMNQHQTSVRAIVYHIAGHELNHLNSIRENYGVK